MRFKATHDLLAQLVVGDLKRINLGPGQRQQKTRPIESGDFCGPGLRDHPARIPLDRRCQAHFIREGFVGPHSRGTELSGISILVVFKGYTSTVSGFRA